MSRTQKYAAAIRDLDKLHESGKLDSATWEVRRRALLTEAEKRPPIVTWVVLGLVAAALIYGAVQWIVAYYQ